MTFICHCGHVLKIVTLIKLNNLDMATNLTDRKKRIVIVAMPTTMLLDVAGPADVFARANVTVESMKGKSEGYKIEIVSRDNSDIVRMQSGAGYICNTLESAEGEIDTLLVAGYNIEPEWQNKNQFLEWLKKMSGETRRIGSVCKGAFVLAEAGLLNKRNATTHWKYCRELQQKYPDIKVDSDPIFVKDGNIYTSAGISAGIDLALALVEEDFGREIAITVARELVLYLKRPGSQSQFSILLADQEAGIEPIRNLQKWLPEHLDKQLSVEDLAEKCSMSPRNFARIFAKETGHTPGKYMEILRVERARRLLEESSLSMDQIAEKCGLGSADTMRRMFQRHLKTNPVDYRRNFRTALI
jgi:transcriptional regulator GlxA family with amidase domain